MSADNQMNMLDELQGLLEMQLKLAHQGNSAGKQIEILGRRADLLVEKITQAGILERAELESQHGGIRHHAHCHLEQRGMNVPVDDGVPDVPGLPQVYQ